jgi:alkanesulfonate monooxygenase SsuD/methylene tetrahydromethanopterin reductase-like flavin-dependent oxidoreductase (luciferase family)
MLAVLLPVVTRRRAMRSGICYNLSHSIEEEPVARRELGMLIPTRQAVLASRERPPLEPMWELARRAEGAGVDGLWVGDSITARPRVEVLTTLAYLAAITRRPRLGTAVLLPALRKPVELALTLANIDQLAGGRLVVGVGTGAAVEPNRREAEALGIDIAQRGKLLSETLDVMCRLWSGETVTFEGTGYRLQEIALAPLPLQRPGPPVLVTCGNAGKILDAQVRRVARFGAGIIVTQVTPDDLRAVRTQLGPRLAALDRDLATMEIAVYCTVRIDEDRARAQQAIADFTTAYYGRAVPERSAAAGAADVAIQTIRDYHDAGATHVIVRFAGDDQLEQFGRFEREVLPALR